MKVPIYTVGYGSRSTDELSTLLLRYGIRYLVDVRSQPYSKFQPDYGRDRLSTRLKAAGISYVFMGDTLGGRPADRTCYVNGKVDYGVIRSKPFYRAGIERLLAAADKGLGLCLMCSEEKPQECHRSKLVGKTLSEQGITVLHIDETGGLKTQEDVLLLLTHGQQTLFDDLGPTSMSRKKY